MARCPSVASPGVYGWLSANYVAAAERGDTHLLVDIALPNGSRYYSISSMGAYANSSSYVEYDGRIINMSPIKISAPTRPGQLGFPEVTFSLGQTDKEVMTLLESQDSRRSAVVIRMGGGSLAQTDYATLFTGVLDRWSQKSATEVELVARPDSIQFESYVPKKPILKGDYPQANTANGNPFGIYMPVAYGTFDGTNLGGAGQLPTVNVRYDGTGSNWSYLICHGYCKALTRVFVESTLKTVSTDYTLYRGVVSGKAISVVSFVSTKQPTNTQNVYVDIDGIEATGDGTGTLISNPVAQIKHWISNFLLGDYTKGNWSADSSILDASSWTNAEALASRYNLEGTFYVGGGTDQTQGTSVVNAWLNSWPQFRMFWNEYGKLSIIFVGPGLSLTAPTQWVREYDIVSMQSLMETNQKVTRVGTQSIYAPKGSKYWQSLDVMDAPEIEEKLTENIEFKYGPSRQA